MNTIKKGRLPTFDRSFEKPKTFDYLIKEKKDFNLHSTMIINKIMTKDAEIVAVVPVKLKSQRVKSKNIRRFADSNLFQIKMMDGTEQYVTELLKEAEQSQDEL